MINRLVGGDSLASLLGLNYNNMIKLKKFSTYKYGDTIEVDGMKGYVVGLDDSGKPDALLSVDCWKGNWNDAMKHEFPGKWNMPGIQFLRDHKTSIVSAFKRKHINETYIWSSTEYTANDNFAWDILASNGDCGTSPKNYPSSIHAAIKL